MRIRFLLFVAFMIWVVGFVSAAPINDTISLNIQTTWANGSVIPGPVSYVFNFNITESSSSSCLNPVYNDTQTVTTDVRGITSAYLPTVGSGGGNLSQLDFDKQYYMCYYRDGTLKDVFQLATVPYSFKTQRINLSEVVIDSNLTLGDYNVSASSGFFSFLGSLTNRITSLFVQDVESSGYVNVSGDVVSGGDVSVTGNVTASWFRGIFNWIIGESSQNYLSFNGTQLDFSESALNNTIDTKISVNNESVVNYIAENNVSVVNYVDGQDVAFNQSVNNYIAQNNLSVNNYIVDYVGVQNDSLRNYLLGYIAVQNGSLVNYIAVVNDSMKNYVDYQDLAFNTSVNNYILQNNLSVNNYIAQNNLSVNNYIVDYVGVQNTSLVNYIAVVNTSMKNYVGVQNTSVINWVSNTFNTTRNNYVADTFVPYTGATKNVALGANNFSVDASVLFVDKNNDRVGIGTTAPGAGYKLDVAGNVNAYGFKVNGTTVSGNTTGAGTTNYVSKWLSASQLGNSVIYDNGTFVGIGTTTPTSLLTLNQAPGELSDNPTLSFGDGDTGFYETADDTMDLSIATILRYSWSSTAFTGTTNYGFSLLRGAGSAATPSYSFVADEDTGIYRDTANYLQFSTGATHRMTIDDSGNVGIGTTLPNSNLEVVGTFNATSNGGSIRIDSNGNVKISL